MNISLLILLPLLACPPMPERVIGRQIASPAEERLREVFPEKVTRRPLYDLDAPPERMLNNGRSYPELKDEQGRTVYEYDADPLELIAALLERIEELEDRVSALEAR